MTSPQVRIWATPCWSASGDLAATAFDGIRRGIVTVDPGDGTTRWWSRPASSSYRLLALASGAVDALAVRCDHDGSAWLVRAVPGGADHRVRMLRAPDPVPVKVVSWAHGGIALEGLLALPPGAGPQRLLVLLHSGPAGGLACGEDPDPAAWAAAGYAVFMPEFRASGIAGHRLMSEAFGRPWLPAADPEAGDVLTGVDMLLANGAADPGALFLLGHSYGGYLAGRILARDHRFAAAATSGLPHHGQCPHPGGVAHTLIVMAGKLPSRAGSPASGPGPVRPSARRQRPCERAPGRGSA